MNGIKLLKREEIDVLKWDELISQSINSLPYAYSWYLDIVAENWDALVMNDYQACMPLVWLRKLGVRCLYQPYYCQQLGVFGKKPITYNMLREFIKPLSREFPYIQINLNSSARVIAEDFRLTEKKNLLLDLNLGYDLLQKKYSDSHRRNITRATKAGLSFSEHTSLKAFQKFYLGNIDHEKELFKKKHERIFKGLTQAFIENEKAGIFSVVDQNGELFAAQVLLYHKNKVINIINTSSPEGKKNGAGHFLFDQSIRKFAGSELILDFEGSSIPGVARFYEGFGARPENFYCYKTTIIKELSQRFL